MFVNSKTNTSGAFLVIHRHGQNGQKVESLDVQYTYSAKVEQADTVLLYTVNKYPFHSICSVGFFFCIFVISVGI